MGELSRRGFLAGACAALSCPAGAAPASPWRALPLVDRDGVRFRMGDRGERLTLVKLWASWCPRCLGELASLRELASAAGERVDVLLVSHPQWWREDLAYAQAQHVPFAQATAAPAAPASVVREALTDGGDRYVVPRSLLLRGATPVWRHDGRLAWSEAAAAIRTLGLG